MPASPASPPPTVTAPVAPPTPVTPAAPATPINNPLSDAFSDLEGMADQNSMETPATPETPSKPPELKIATPPPDKPQPDTVKPPEPPAPDVKQPDETPKVPAQLRKAYEDLKAKHRALELEHEKVRTTKPQPDPEIMTRLEKEEKRRAELEDEMRYVAYERSQEYKEKYQQPFIEAYQAGQKRMESLDIQQKTILVEDPTTGEKTEKIIRQGRAATAEDFNSLMAIPSDRDARKFAKEMFGEDAALALQHREKVIELNNVQAKALEDFKKTGAEREKQQTEARSKAEKQQVALWESLNKAAAEKFPTWFKPAGLDAEGNPLDAKGDELLQKGFELVDRAFSGDASKLSSEELTKLHSAIRNRAAAFGRIAHQNKTLQAEIAELKKALEQFKTAEPGAGHGGPQKLDETKFGENALDSYAQAVA